MDRILIRFGCFKEQRYKFICSIVKNFPCRLPTGSDPQEVEQNISLLSKGLVVLVAVTKHTVFPGFQQSEKIPVQRIELTQVAKNRMVEDFPLTAREIIQDKDAWYYEGDVRSMEGIGRFVLSLPEHITILEGEEVRQYVRDKADYILKVMLP